MDEVISDLLQSEPQGSRRLFPVVWSEGHRNGLRAFADGERQGFSPIDQLMSHALLLCADGDFETAEEFMLSLLRDNASALQRNGEILISLLNGFFTVQRTDIVTALLVQRFGFADRLEICFEETGNGVGVMRWDISRDRQHRLVYDAAALRSDATRLEVLNLFWEFPLFANYAAQPIIEHGSVTLCRHDIATRPGLGYCGVKPDTFLIPDGGFVPSKGYDWSRHVLTKNRPRWEDKRPAAFWRGATTGMKRSERDWRELERVRLCEIARRHQHTGLFDVGLSNVAQFSDPAIIKEINESGLVAGRVPWQDWGQYRYQIDIDGNSSPYSNLIQRLLTGSPVLKVESARGLMQWFYSELIPWQNYVPISADMSDLLDKVKWLVRNDEFAQTVGRNGLAMVERMTIERELERSVPVISSAFRYFRSEGAYILPYGMPLRPTEFAGAAEPPLRADARPSCDPVPMHAMPAATTADKDDPVPASTDPYSRKREIEARFEAGAHPELEREYLTVLQAINRMTCGIIDVRWPGIPAPLFMRCGSADLGSFTQVFAHRKYDFALGFTPRRILDLGAHAGYAAAFLAARFPHAEIVSLEPSADDFRMLSVNTATYRRIKRLNASVCSHGASIGGVGAAGPGQERSALSVPDILERVGWNRFDFLTCDIDGAEAGVFETCGSLIAGTVQGCAILVPPGGATSVDDLMRRTFEDSSFRHFRHGDLLVCVRRSIGPVSGAMSPAYVLRPDRGVRKLSLTNVGRDPWAYGMFDGESCQLHPGNFGQARPELATSVDLDGHSAFHSDIQVINPQGFAVEFRVMIQDESDGHVVAEATQTVEAQETASFVVPLPEPGFGLHRVALQTVMAERGQPNHQADANWISPHFR